VEIHVHIHDGTVKEGRKPRKRTTQSTSTRKAKPKRKGKPMTAKTQRAINKGRRAKGLKPIKWKKKGV
jgi:uncharacterized protein YkwD